MPRTGLTLSSLVGLLLVFVLVHAKVLLLLLRLRLVGDAAEQGPVPFRPRPTAGPPSRAGGSTAHKVAGGVAWLFFCCSLRASEVVTRGRKIALWCCCGRGGGKGGACVRACKGKEGKAAGAMPGKDSGLAEWGESGSAWALCFWVFVHVEERLPQTSSQQRSWAACPCPPHPATHPTNGREACHDNMPSHMAHMSSSKHNNQGRACPQPPPNKAAQSQTHDAGFDRSKRDDVASWA